MAMKWHGEAVQDRIDQHIGANINAALLYAQGKIITNIGRTQPRVKSGYGYRGLDPSKPGEYPKIVSADLKGSIAIDYDAGTKTGYVGTNIKYGKDLEAKTGKGKRPWLRRSLMENLDKIKAKLGRRMK